MPRTPRSEVECDGFVYYLSGPDVAWELAMPTTAVPEKRACPHCGAILAPGSSSGLDEFLGLPSPVGTGATAEKVREL